MIFSTACRKVFIAFVLALACVAGSVAHDASAAVRLMVEARYFTDSRNGESGLVRGKFPLQRSIHPFRALARRMMNYTGDADGALRIEAEGVALGSLYDYMENRMRLRHLRFTGVTIEGRVSLASRRAGLRCTATFAGTIAPRTAGLVVGVWDYRESPHLAPFVAALAEPGSFVAALAAIIGAVYGPAPLIAASGDADEIVAGHARKALGRLEGDGMVIECATP